jgi:hypothetical protein
MATILEARSPVPTLTVDRIHAIDAALFARKHSTHGQVESPCDQKSREHDAHRNLVTLFGVRLKSALLWLQDRLLWGTGPPTDKVPVLKVLS